MPTTANGGKYGGGGDNILELWRSQRGNDPFRSGNPNADRFRDQQWGLVDNNYGGVNRIDKSVPQGLTEFYNDSFGALGDWMRGRRGGAMMSGHQSMLDNFQGHRDEFREFMEFAAPFLASGSLESSDAFQNLTNFNQYNNPMQALGTVQGQTAQAGQQALQQGQQQLGRSGLGRSAANASLASSVAQNVGDAQAGQFTGLYQQDLQQRRQQALQAFDAQRNVAQIALGMNPMPRQQAPDSNPWAPVLAGVGSAVGTGLGMWAGGGF